MTQPSGILYLLRLWFGVTLPVSRKVYVLSGLGLVLFKYAVEALAVGTLAGAAYWPWDFLNPLVSARTDMLRGGPDWLPWGMFIWSLPFLWIATTMSVRRAADADLSPWLGLAVLIPGLNFLVMLGLSVARSVPDVRWSPREEMELGAGDSLGAALAVGLSLLVGTGMMLISVYLLSSYGAALFLGTPLMMGATAGFIYNRTVAHGYGSAVMLGLASVSLACAALLLFALEGMICVVMALPMLIPLGMLGGVLGKAIADATRRPPHELLAGLLVLPLLASVEAYIAAHFNAAPTREVMTSVEIAAPPEVVWQNVVSFPELAPPSEWYFRWGIACPQRARIAGSGVGATRFCEFTTGTFVEPITVWDAPRRLAFDVTEQPAPMFELSPYRHVHPPHLDGYLQSERGEFRLIPLPDGRTRLEGRTWYHFRMYPQGYWTLWSDLLIHRIHVRVLRHIQLQAEGGT